MTAGLDLGDKYSYLCLLDAESGEVIEEAPPSEARSSLGSVRGGGQRLPLSCSYLVIGWAP